MASKIHLVIDQGTDFECSFDMIDDNDAIINLTGYSGTAEMRKYYTSNTSYEFGVAITANTGEITLSMNNITTNAISAGRYVYDCELTDADGKITRLVEGIVTITPRIRKS